jgi:hypothetical protein
MTPSKKIIKEKEYEEKDIGFTNPAIDDGDQRMW